MTGDLETFAIIGAAMEVHRTLGAGFLERVYVEAMCLEFIAKGIDFRREVPLRVDYKGSLLAAHYRADLLCYSSIIVETKAIRTLSPADHAQIINYLRASRIKRGILLNFGAPSLQYRRFAN